MLLSTVKAALLFGRSVVRHPYLTRIIPSSRTMASLNSDEVSRYSRQLLLPEIGIAGQRKLKSSSILLVGAGGLGCPAALYLAAAGFGRIGIIDDDSVERSNLHRQVLHNEERVGMPKVLSAVETLEPLNSNVQLEPIKSRLTAANAMSIIEKYDIILDATDNAMTRYLLSDVCVLNKKPLISGAALRFEGQLTVYNWDEGTPCYRCLFPIPPPPGTVTNCSDGGVLGVIPGIIGSLQALEAIKIAIGQRPSYAGKMLLFDGLSGTFRDIKIRNRKEDCVSCGRNPTIGPGLIDYSAFCGVPACGMSTGLKILAPHERITCADYHKTIFDKKSHLLIDVRPAAERELSKVEHAVGIPLNKLTTEEGITKIKELLKEKSAEEIYVHCRRGNASQKAVRFLTENINELGKGDMIIKDLIGGIEAWSAEVDPKIPVY